MQRLSDKKILVFQIDTQVLGDKLGDVLRSNDGPVVAAADGFG